MPWSSWSSFAAPLKSADGLLKTGVPAVRQRLIRLPSDLLDGYTRTLHGSLHEYMGHLRLQNLEKWTVATIGVATMLLGASIALLHLRFTMAALCACH